MTDERSVYARAVLGPRDDLLDDVLRRSLLDRELPTIMVDDETGRLLQLLTRMMRPQRVIEVGTLFGYSAIHIARAMPPGGRITTLERDPAPAAIARENFAAAGVQERIEVVVGDALGYLRTVPRESVHMLFIDADKASYPAYLKAAYPLLAPGGLLIADDAFADGDFSAENGERGEPGRHPGITTYNRAVGRSPQLFSALVPTGTGLMISHKEW